MKILVIQTAFIGDAILATAFIEKLNSLDPQNKIDILVRKGNETLFDSHPFLNKVLIWNKKEGKLKNLLKLIPQIRRERYDRIYNLHRFASSGILTAFGKANQSAGFSKNPLSFMFSRSVKHEIGNGKHETQRNLELLGITDDKVKPRLYPSPAHYKKVLEYQTAPYICIAPTSVWYTKQYPAEKWIELIDKNLREKTIYLLGAPSDFGGCEKIRSAFPNERITNLSGKLSFLESAALIEKAEMNYVNDSAPLHLCSAMNAPTKTVFCSTVPEFGFGPLSDNSQIIQTETFLPCKPCGLHGYKACPLGHFKCAFTIRPDQFK